MKYFVRLALTPLALIAIMHLAPAPTFAQDAEEAEAEQEEEEDDSPMKASTFSAIKARLVGPALSSGRIGDIAVDPNNHAHWFVAVSSGNVWKTVNNGITFTPVFDNEGSYSIGCLAMDPNNPQVVWVGSGENNSQRSVSWGDGVYKTTDGGASWTNVGLPDSEHIGMIAIDPRDSDVVYVAAQGPLWNSGGDRGLYKTTDGGETWERILHISDDTGINEIHLDPRNPDVMYASSYQRRRHVWTLINGGPESGIHKSTDGGATWREITSGLPSSDKGRIGMDIAPANPDVIYAIVEAAEDGGVYRSTDRGETWTKRSSYMSSSPQYYNELVCDPHDVDRVYSLDTFFHVTEDGGKSFKRVPIDYKHVDDHALWINPNDPNHMILGCDGGIYDTYDRGANWRFMPNLPVTQFYRVSVDQSLPFYYVYGGTQDNNTLGAPHRTRNPAGITNEDWFITVGGDGYETQVDPTDPNIVYSLWQYGGLVRHDRRSGEITDIKPREKPGEEPYVWNWDSPLLLSPHNPKRLYFAGNRLFRSNDGGNSWETISPDLTRGLDRNQLEVMGVIQKPDAVSKHRSTSIYGNAVSLSESPVIEGLLYVGTDDGLVHVSGDDGGSWRRIDTFPGVPEMTYVSWLLASNHDANVVYAGFDNHKNGDFTPYALRSSDRGRTWESIAGDLPEDNVVYAIQEDHVNPDLLFAGTEYGAYFSLNRGETWMKFSGLPTIAVRDIDVQRRENDLALATFGRGIYVIEDYTPLRTIDEDLLEQDAVLFPIKDALAYMQTSRFSDRSGRGWQGATYFAAPNPPYGAIFTYYLKDALTSREDSRKKAEKEDDWEYPTIEEFREERREPDPRIVLTVRDRNGDVVRRVTGKTGKGMHRIAWDLRYPSTNPINLGSSSLAPWQRAPSGPHVAPGRYIVTLAKEVDGVMTELAGPLAFNVRRLGDATFASEDPEAVLAFQRDVAELNRAIRGTLRAATEVQDRIKHLRAAVMETPEANAMKIARLDALHNRLRDALIELRGDPVKSARSVAQPPTIRGRVGNIMGSQWWVTSPPTQTELDGYEYAATDFARVLSDMNGIFSDLTVIELEMEEAGAPWTPGRLPTWSRD
ncbi:MAG: glycosyl hydrolase [Planctomycetota bacterium]